MPNSWNVSDYNILKILAVLPDLRMSHSPFSPNAISIFDTIEEISFRKYYLHPYFS